ncbi:hypothetical protein DFR55_1038 [Herbinix hemicellulosilytica]|uniref:Uncharacterized protein n=1 Tax=Herbinix hemicellulosilytica TaxID=1564487 RepID=A0A0H5SEA6_HERHM|nr:hypothetical protein [Herbinix hemicellulosilytica]RBP60025.1 hypothetical protein DFR55_1038 [Herbinix hemicellulosilytica]CRZ33749.1 hypothetical protein HHT355_0544 [Herbinix hemicellulosilytica]
MNKRLKSMYKEIINNKNLKENIPVFLDLTADKYYTSALFRLALHYFTFYEMYCDDSRLWDSQLKEYFEKVNRIISQLVNDSQRSENKDFIQETDEIRSGIIARMNCLTYYTDLFEIYEYALNRVEYRFKDVKELEDDEELARKILRFIFESNDSVMVNELIKEVIGQLPVRITKQKYFEYLKDGFKELIGASQDSFEIYLYMIRSSALLDSVKDIENIYPDLWEKKENLEKIDFKNITKEEYERAINLISEAVKFLETATTAYYSLTELVNDLYALLVCDPFKGDTSEEKELKEAAFYIIREINTEYYKNTQDEISQEVVDKFKILEGFQEETEFDLLSLEDALFHLSEHHKKRVEDTADYELFNSLLLSKDLLSDSLFIDLHKSKSTDKIGKERCQKEVDRLIEDLSGKFQTCDRMIMRAIMANTINKLPVFFNNHTEVMNYVIYSLSKCTDMAEKYACIEILNEIMDYQLI